MTVKISLAENTRSLIENALCRNDNFMHFKIRMQHEIEYCNTPTHPLSKTRYRESRTAVIPTVWVS